MSVAARTITKVRTVTATVSCVRIPSRIVGPSDYASEGGSAPLPKPPPENPVAPAQPALDRARVITSALRPPPSALHPVAPQLVVQRLCPGGGLRPPSEASPRKSGCAGTAGARLRAGHHVSPSSPTVRTTSRSAAACCAASLPRRGAPPPFRSLPPIGRARLRT